MKIRNFLRNNFRGGEPLRHFCHPKWFRRVANILMDIEGVGCHIEKPTALEGRGWKVVVDWQDPYRWQGIPAGLNVKVREGSWYRNDGVATLETDGGQPYKTISCSSGDYVWAEVTLDSDNKAVSVALANGQSYEDKTERRLIGQLLSANVWVQHWRGGDIDDNLVYPDSASLDWKDDQVDYKLQVYGFDTAESVANDTDDLFLYKDVSTGLMAYATPPAKVKPDSKSINWQDIEETTLQVYGFNDVADVPNDSDDLFLYKDISNGVMAYTTLPAKVKPDTKSIDWQDSAETTLQVYGFDVASDVPNDSGDLFLYKDTSTGLMAYATIPKVGPDGASLDWYDTGQTQLQIYGWSTASNVAADTGDLFVYKDAATSDAKYMAWSSIVQEMSRQAVDAMNDPDNWDVGNGRYWHQGGGTTTCYGSDIGDPDGLMVISLDGRRLYDSDGVNLDWSARQLLGGDSGTIKVDWDANELVGSGGWAVTDATEATSGDTSGAASFRVTGGVRIAKQMICNAMYVANGDYGVNSSGDVNGRDIYVDSGQAYFYGSTEGVTDTGTFTFTRDTGGTISVKIKGGIIVPAS